MTDFILLNTAFQVAKRFEAENNIEILPPRNETERLNREIFSYVKSHLLIVFIDEFNRKSSDLINQAIKDNTHKIQSKKKFKHGIWDNLNEKYFKSHEGKYHKNIVLYSKYNNYRVARNQVAHFGSNKNTTWNEYANVSIKGYGEYLNIVDIADLMMKLVKEEVENSIN